MTRTDVAACPSPRRPSPRRPAHRATLLPILVALTVAVALVTTAALGHRWLDRSTESEGALPDGVSVFDDRYPGVAKLDADLLAALRQAAGDAAADGVHLTVNSGWRSVSYQAQLLRDAVVEHGSEAEAARWVATPGTSAHETGDAVDVGPTAGAAWLADHGAAHGLCQTYANEAWHFELHPDAVDHGCPAPFPDPTYDRRLQG